MLSSSAHAEGLMQLLYCLLASINCITNQRFNVKQIETLVPYRFVNRNRLNTINGRLWSHSRERID